MGHIKQETMPVIRDLRDFDRQSGNRLERLVFNYRPLFMLLMALATVVLGYMAATRLELRPSFEKMIPQSQPYIQNFLENRQSLRGLGNSVRVVVENTQGDIFDPGYLDVLKQAGPDGKKTYDRVAARVGMGRWGKVEEIAYPCIFLASDASSWMTGETIPIDGGRHLTCAR